MNIDIRTLIFILGITHIIQVVVFIHQYLINKTYRGIGWWLLWSVAEVIGFTFMLLRETPSLRSMAIIGQNSMIVLGVIFLYVGIRRFLDRKVNLAILLPIYAGYLAALMFFLYVHDDIQVRGIIISAALAGFSFLSAQALFVNKPRAISASANFVAAVLMIHGFYFAFRAVAITIGARADNFFTPTMFNVAMFMDALVAAILWTFGFIIMINQRLNAEATEAKERFELIFNTGPDAALITRLKDGLILNINEGFTALTGYTREEAIGRSSLDVNIWEDPADRQKIVHELREKGFCENFESVFRTKEGDRIIGIMSAKLITLHGLPHIVSVTRDITERKQAEEALRKSEDKYKGLTENINLGIFRNTVGPEGKFVEANPSVIGMFGYKNKEEFLAINVSDLYQNPEERNKFNDKMLKEGFVKGEELRLEKKDGSLVVGSVSAVAVKDKQGHVKYFDGIIDNITERKRKEDKIIALLREKETLLKEVHHRIKNNMSSLMSLLSLQSNALKNPEAVAALLEARDRMRSMGVLYDKLYRSENLREMSIKDYLPPLVDEIVGVFPNRGLVKVEKRIDDIMLGVKALSPLGIIVNELITNAMKHAFAGREDGWISISASAKDGRVILIVEDNGNGIPESVDIENPSGFGLQLVGMLTAQLDGAIRIERRKGARFVLEFDA